MKHHWIPVIAALAGNPLPTRQGPRGTSSQEAQNPEMVPKALISSRSLRVRPRQNFNSPAHASRRHWLRRRGWHYARWPGPLVCVSKLALKKPGRGLRITHSALHFNVIHRARSPRSRPFAPVPANVLYLILAPLLFLLYIKMSHKMEIIEW